MVNVNQLLQAMVQKEASDLFFSAGARVSMKIDGVLRPISLPELTAETSQQLAYELMSEEQIRRFETHRELNFGYGIPGVGRFRVNVFRQRGAVAMVIRRLSTSIPSLAELGLPPVLERLALERRGLILVVGATGSGKSTTLASMIDYRNSNSPGHILTVEDPVEFVHRHKKSIVNQREVGTDTDSYETALVNALREAPDVILIGEIRDRDTMQQVINFANTGHLCLSTLHSINSHQALTRIMNFFPLETRQTVLFDLAACLVGIVSQRLVRTVKGGRVPAVEVFTADYHMKQMIREGRVDELKDMMESATSEDMQTFDQAIVKLYKAGIIDYEEAQANADSPRQLHLLIHGSGEVQFDGRDSKSRAPGSSAKSSAAADSLPEIDLPPIS